MQVLVHTSPSRLARNWSHHFTWVVLMAGLGACKSPPSESTQQAAQLTPEPERFQFALPKDYVEQELRGEGSETLHAPADARLQSLLLSGQPPGLQIEAGDSFAVEVRFEPTLTSLPAAPAGTRRALSESDLVVFERGGAYSFVLLRELVPEWDESDRRRVSCSSKGALDASPEAGFRYSKAAVEHMVAACRSLELPRLE